MIPSSPIKCPLCNRDAILIDYDTSMVNCHCGKPKDLFNSDKNLNFLCQLSASNGINWFCIFDYEKSGLAIRVDYRDSIWTIMTYNRKNIDNIAEGQGNLSLQQGAALLQRYASLKAFV